MRRKVVIAAAGVAVAALVAVCVGVYGFSTGPTYGTIADGFCVRLGYPALAESFGRFQDDVKEAAPADERENAIACRATFAGMPVTTLTFEVTIYPSESDARDRFSKFVFALRRTDLMDLDLRVQDAQWGFNQFMTVAAVHDGNLFMGMTAAGHFDIDEVNVHFGEPLAAFMKTALDNIAKTSA